MINGKKVIVVMPAYNAEKTLKNTYNEVPLDIVDDIILVDDCSQDKTSELAEEIGIRYVIRHDKNIGYGGNHVHFTVDVPKKYSVLNTITMFKSRTAMRIFEKHPNFRKRYPKGKFWSR